MIGLWPIGGLFQVVIFHFRRLSIVGTMLHQVSCVKILFEIYIFLTDCALEFCKGIEYGRISTFTHVKWSTTYGRPIGLGRTLLYNAPPFTFVLMFGPLAQFHLLDNTPCVTIDRC